MHGEYPLDTKYEPPRAKINNVVFEQVRHKSVCAVTEDG